MGVFKIAATTQFGGGTTVDKGCIAGIQYEFD